MIALLEGAFNTERPAVRIIPNRTLRFEMVEPLIFQTIRGEICVAPPTFWTDLTSISGLLPLKKDGPWTLGAIIHDWLYFCRTVFLRQGSGALKREFISRARADLIFDEARRNTPKLRARVNYGGVRIGGWSIWNKYRDLDDNPNQLHLLDLAETEALRFIGSIPQGSA